MICNDVSERFWQLEGTGQWIKGKSAETFGPLGPWLVTADEIRRPAEPRHVPRRERQAHADRQHEHHDLRRGAARRLPSASMVLEPGDVVTTGTPPGVGSGKKPHADLPEGRRRDGARRRELGKQKQKVVAYKRLDGDAAQPAIARGRRVRACALDAEAALAEDDEDAGGDDDRRRRR